MGHLSRHLWWQTLLREVASQLTAAASPPLE